MYPGNFTISLFFSYAHYDDDALTLLSARKKELRRRRRKRREVKEREDKQELQRQVRTLPVRGIGCEKEEKAWTVLWIFYSTGGAEGARD